MERVPPIGVTAWGVNGVIFGCDARTKAFQDAIIDVQLVQEQITKCQKQISIIQDEMSLLHMDVKLNKHRVQKVKQQTAQHRNLESDIAIQERLIKQIRYMESQLNKKSHMVRYKMLQKENLVKEYQLLIKRRHWAIFQTMKHITTDKSILSEPINEALYELEMNEAAVRTYSMKQREEPEEQ
jgi:hypothetical protein